MYTTAHALHHRGRELYIHGFAATPPRILWHSMLPHNPEEAAAPSGHVKRKQGRRTGYAATKRWIPRQLRQIARFVSRHLGNNLAIQVIQMGEKQGGVCVCVGGFELNFLTRIVTPSGHVIRLDSYCALQECVQNCMLSCNAQKRAALLQRGVGAIIYAII